MCHDDLYFLLNVLLPQASGWAREGPLGSPDMTQDSARVLLPPARPSCPSLGWETAPSPLPRVPESPSESSAVWPPLGREGGDHAHTEPDPDPANRPPWGGAPRRSLGRCREGAREVREGAAEDPFWGGRRRRDVERHRGCARLQALSSRPVVPLGFAYKARTERENY